MEDTKIMLSEKEIPTSWYNILPDLPAPMDPPINPGTKQPVGPDDLAPIFAMDCIMQEVSMEPSVEIPEEVLNAYRLYRPTPLIRAHRLEEALGTPAKIYYKYEGVSPAGSHKPNTAIAQAFYNKKAGKSRLATETGAGQWGSALSHACAMFGLDCTVYMVKVSYDQKPYRRIMMETWGAKVIPSPSRETKSGSHILDGDPDCPGSLGIAISEAVEDGATHDDANYSIGSVANHALLHQTVIGQEAKLQMEKAGDYPDIVIGCVGGGSNFAGLSFPFVRDKMKEGKTGMRVIAVEPKACPTLTRGKFEYDFGDEAELTPMFKMYTLGHKFVPAGIHAGGLRYHGDSPSVSLLYDQGVIEAVAVHQIPVFEAAVMFARTEGILPAPESAHAILTTIDEAKKCKESGEAKTILFNLSGHGHFDLGAYDDYLNNRLENFDYEHGYIEKD